MALHALSGQLRDFDNLATTERAIFIMDKTPWYKLTDEQLAQRFWDKVDIKRSKKECWLWLAGTDSKGRYGLYRYKRKIQGAHRIAYLLTFGEIPPNLDVMHSCDTTLCCNPNHLSAGTRKENMEDMMERERDNFSHGIDRPDAKLTDENVKEIRRLYKIKAMTQKAMSKMFHVSDTTIWGVVHHIYWNHIKED